MFQPMRIVAAIAFLGCVVALTDASVPGGKAPPDPLRKLSPMERMRVVGKKNAQRVIRGPVAETIVERGVIEAVNKSDLVCKVRGMGQDIPIIRWVVDDGATVKKGEKVLEFDAPHLIAELKAQKMRIANAEAELKKAADQFDRVKEEVGIEVKLADIEVRLAQAELKKYKGGDQAQIEALELQIDKHRLLAMRTKLHGADKVQKAGTEREAKKSVHDKELGRLREIEADLAQCVLVAPRDGFVFYYAPERGSSGGTPLVAVGEPVRQGQKLMAVCDLSELRLHTFIHEATIARVRADQKVNIHVDAYPQRAFTGKVTQIATVASPGGFVAKDIKVYEVSAALVGDVMGLKPGMSGELGITLSEKTDCLRLPASAILGQGQDRYCYVFVGNELRERKVVVGLANRQFVEIVAGLKEGDEVLLRTPPPR